MPKISLIDNENVFTIRSYVPGCEGIIAAGPLTKQPASEPYRWVLRENSENRLVVCHQYLGISAHGAMYHVGWGNGDYFKRGELVEAARKFAGRLVMDAAHYASIYRCAQCEQPLEDRDCVLCASCTHKALGELSVQAKAAGALTPVAACAVVRGEEDTTEVFPPGKGTQEKADRGPHLPTGKDDKLSSSGEGGSQ